MARRKGGRFGRRGFKVEGRAEDKENGEGMNEAPGIMDGAPLSRQRDEEANTTDKGKRRMN